MEKLPILYIVIPCYNEEEVLKETTKRLKTKLKKLLKEKTISTSCLREYLYPEIEGIKMLF